MKNKILKIVVIVLVVLVVALVINNFRNRSIMNKVFETATNNRESEINNMYLKVVATQHNNSEIFFKTEEFYLNGKYEHRNSQPGNDDEIIKVDINKEEIIENTSGMTDENCLEMAKEAKTTMLAIFDDDLKKETLSNYLLKPITKKDGYYELKYAENRTLFVNKDTYQIEMIKQNDSTMNYALNTVKESDLSF